MLSTLQIEGHPLGSRALVIWHFSEGEDGDGLLTTYMYVLMCFIEPSLKTGMIVLENENNQGNNKGIHPSY